MAADILIVDDETDIRELVAGILQDEGHRTRLARDSDEALRAIEERRPHLVILDIWLQGSRLDGLEVLSVIKRTYPDLPRTPGTLLWSHSRDRWFGCPWQFLSQAPRSLPDGNQKEADT